LTTGVRFGLESGRGATAVPTRATIIGALTAVAVAVATIVFAASLDRVVNDGKFYGSNYDVAIDFDGDVVGNADEVASVIATVKDDPAVDRVGEIRISEISVNDEPITAITFSRGEGAVEPTIGEGRAPIGADQIALGGTTMRQLGITVGDRVRVRSSGFDGEATVVGRAVLPGVGLYQGADRTSIGDGALVPTEALGPRVEGSADAEKGLIAVRLVRGADREAFERRMTSDFDKFEVVQFRVNARPSDIDSLDRLRSIPTVLSAVLVGLVTVTVVNAMVVAVRRRRRDIAVLQTLGSTTGDVVTMGMWQGVTIGTASLLFGIPLGIVGGRWLWTVLANGFGTLAEPVVPLPGMVVLGLVVMVLAATTGAIPVRRGLRHRPADVLRSE
jgi:hypothetical protein